MRHGELREFTNCVFEVGVPDEAVLIVDRLLGVNDDKPKLFLKPIVLGANVRGELHIALIRIVQARYVLAGLVELNLSRSGDPHFGVVRPEVRQTGL